MGVDSEQVISDTINKMDTVLPEVDEVTVLANGIKNPLDFLKEIRHIETPQQIEQYFLKLLKSIPGDTAKTDNQIRSDLFRELIIPLKNHFPDGETGLSMDAEDAIKQLLKLTKVIDDHGRPGDRQLCQNEIKLLFPTVYNNWVEDEATVLEGGSLVDLSNNSVLFVFTKLLMQILASNGIIGVLAWINSNNNIIDGSLILYLVFFIEVARRTWIMWSVIKKMEEKEAEAAAEEAAAVVVAEEDPASTRPSVLYHRVKVLCLMFLSIITVIATIQQGGLVNLWGNVVDSVSWGAKDTMARSAGFAVPETIRLMRDMAQQTGLMAGDSYWKWIVSSASGITDYSAGQISKYSACVKLFSLISLGCVQMFQLVANHMKPGEVLNVGTVVGNIVVELDADTSAKGAPPPYDFKAMSPTQEALKAWVQKTTTLVPWSARTAVKKGGGNTRLSKGGRNKRLSKKKKGGGKKRSLRKKK